MLYHNTLGRMATLISGLALCWPAWSLNLVATIPPLHSLVVQVAEPSDQVTLLIPASQSPHNFAMRPSMARDLAQADGVFWMGPNLETGLARALSQQANSVALSSDQASNTDHGHHDDHDHHDHEDIHGWLSVRQSQQMLQDIAHVLGQWDPTRAELFERRAEQASHKLERLFPQWTEQMQSASTLRYWVFHDAYGAFEAEHGIDHQAVIQINVNSNPSSRQLSALRGNMQGQTGCAFIEPQLDPRWARLAIGDQPIEIRTLDPLGDAHQPGAELHRNVLAGMVQVFTECAASTH